MKLSRLKNNKGFTLIELIVVIAIIGVLAAILIPTLIGYVQNSRVSSANSMAGELRKNINYFLTEADVSNYGMKISDTEYCEPTISIVNDIWTIQMNPSTNINSIFKNSVSYTWTGSGSGQANDVKVSISADSLLAISLATMFPEIENGFIKFRLESGKCVALYFTEELTSAPANAPTLSQGGWSSDVFTWDNNHQGITLDGYIVGTAPILQFG